MKVSILSYENEKTSVKHAKDVTWVFLSDKVTSYE